MRRSTAIDYTRQLDLIPPGDLQKSHVTLIGAGSVGSYVALTLGKMGLGTMTVYDDDIVDPQNIPNQFFELSSVGQSKVKALKSLISKFTGMKLIPYRKSYLNHPLSETTIVATDSMASRRRIWEEFNAQKTAKVFIEARMGAQLGQVHVIRKKNGVVSRRDFNFYERRLYSDDQVKQPKCTAKTIIYNVQMLAALVSRAYKAIITNERGYPREVTLNLTTLDERTYMYER